MSLDMNKRDLVIGVVGAGAMGRGIAQTAAQAGIEVRLFDNDERAVDSARASIADVLGKQVSKGKLEAEARDVALSLLNPISSLAGVAGCDLVVESVVEKLDIKRALFRELEDIVREDAILATNTSSLSVTALAAACARPGRVAGCHFFNPVPLMKLVELVETPLTESWVVPALATLAERMGKIFVVAKDMPGFVVNHAGRAFVPEALRIVSEGISDFSTIDRIMRDTAGFRMGPFELQDLIGLDVGQLVMESIYRQFYEEPRFRVTPLVAQRVAAGLHGRKTGRGFYSYREGAIEVEAEPAAPVIPKNPPPIWVSPADPQLADKLLSAFHQDGVRVETGPAPSAEALIFVTPLGRDTTTTCVELQLDPRRTVAVETLFPMNRRRTLMGSPAMDASYLEIARGLLAIGGAPVSVIRDSPGFVAPRIVAQIVSIGCDIAQQRVASPHDVDLAVRLGLGYPHGPLAMGDALGPRNILKILESLHAFYGDPRYRPSAWLRRRATLGLSLLQND